MRYPLKFVGYCLLLMAAPCQAADFIVHVPDEYIEEGLKWNGWYRDNGSDQHGQTREQWFLDRCIFSEGTKWVRDFFIISASHGKIRSFDSSGITVEVHD